jgi:hypothetical protein
MENRNLWSQLREILNRFLGSRAEEHDRPLRSSTARERFWSELREGQREAEAAAKTKGT